MEATTIKLNQKTKEDLNQFREYKNESYEEIVHKLVYIAKTAQENPKLSQQTVKEIEAARERIKKGEFYGENEMKKILGL